MSSGTSRRSWRDAATVRPGVPNSNRAARWLTTLFGLALMGALAWLVWYIVSLREPKTHLIAITTGDSDKLSIPPVLFETESLAPLIEIGNAANRERQRFNYIPADQVQQSGGIGQLDDLLANPDIDPADTVVLYISGHAISDQPRQSASAAEEPNSNREAYVLCRDYNVREADAARYEIRSALESLSRVDAAVKLLVLDTGRLGTAPRLATLVNEVPEIVARDVESRADPNLWVLIAQAPRQTSMNGLGRRRSPFAAAFSDVLSGQDRDDTEDREIYLADLVDRVQAACQRASGGTQSPQLFHGTSSAPDPSRVLVRRLPPPGGEQQAASSDEAAAADPAGTRKPAVDTSPTADSSTPGSSSDAAASDGNDAAGKGSLPAVASAQPSSGDGGEAGSETANLEAPAAASGTPAGELEATSVDAPPSTPAATIAVPTGKTVSAASPAAAVGETTAAAAPTAATAAAIRIWQLRDALDPQIDRESAATSLYPVDYAPHLWRELNGMILDLSLFSEGGAALDTPNTTKLLAAYVAGLEQLVSGSASGNPQSDEPVLRRLLFARRDTVGLPISDQLETLPPEVRATVLVRYRQLYRARLLVDWHAVALNAATPNDLALERISGEIGRLIAQLADYERLLAGLEGTSLRSWADLNAAVALTDSILRTSQRIDGLLAERLESAIEKVDRGVFARHLEAFLQTPLPTAEQRLAIEAALRGRDPTGALVEGDASANYLPAVMRHLELERKLLAVVDATAAQPLQQIVDRIATSRPAEQLLAWRLAAAEIRDFYAAAPEIVAALDEASPATDPGRLVGERMLPLIHPRDATAVTVRAPPRLRWLPPTDLRIWPESEGPVPLDVDAAASVTFLIEARHIASPQASFRVEFDERLVRLQAGDQALVPGEDRPVTISPSGTAQVVLAATATRYIDPGAPTQSTTLRVGVDAGDSRTTTSVELTLPSPNEVALFATLVSPRLPQQQYEGRGLLLQPYPNREHSFEFAVQNLSNRPKQVVAKFYAVPRPTNAVWYPGALLGGGREPRPFAPLASWAAGSEANKRLLAVSAPVDLPGSSEAVRLVLRDPTASTEAAAGSGTQPPPSPPPTQTVDITHGMLCVIEEVATTPVTAWTRWIEIRPLTPNEFLATSGSYDHNRGRIELQFAARDLNGDGTLDLPPAALVQPVLLYWPLGDDLRPEFTVIPGQLTPQQTSTTLSLEGVAARSRRTTSIHVDVDGYPRGFVSELDLETRSTARQIRSDRSYVRIDTLALASEPERIYQFARDFQLQIPEEGPEVRQVPRSEGGRRADAPLNVLNKPLKLKIQFRVDAKSDSFRPPAYDRLRDLPPDRVVLRLQPRGGRPDRDQMQQTYFADRQTAAAASIGADGNLVLRSVVGDYDVLFDAPGQNNSVSTLVLELFRDNERVGQDSIDIGFDATRPVIDTSGIPREVDMNTTFQAPILVTEMSGLDSVVAAFAVRPKQPIDAAAAPNQYDAVFLSKFPQSGRDEISLPLPIVAPEKPGDYFLRLQVTDRAGLTTITPDITIRVKEPFVPPPPPVIGTIRGVVKFNGQKPVRNDFTVRIEDQPIPPQKTTRQGTYAFSGIKAGEYVILAEGQPNNNLKYAGKIEVKIEKLEDFKPARDIAVTEVEEE